MKANRVAVALAGLLTAAIFRCAPAAMAKTAHVTAPSLRVAETRGAGKPLWRRWVDLDGDGRLDLIVVSGSSSTPLPEEDRVEALVAYLKVTPAFLDKRQVLLFRQTPEGLASWGEPLQLTGDTAAVDVADLDGDGRAEILYAAGYRIYAFSRSESGTYSPAPRTVADAEMLLGYSRAFVPGARLATTAVRGSPAALLLATAHGIELRRGSAAGAFDAKPTLLLKNPFRSVAFHGNEVMLHEPLPRIADADGDGTLDLILQEERRVAVFRGTGGSSFTAEPLQASLPSSDRRNRGTPLLQDVDADGLLDLFVSREEDQDDQPAEQAGSQQGKEDAKPKKKNSKDSPVNTAEIWLGRAGFKFPETPDSTVQIRRTEKLEGAESRLLKIDADERADLLVLRYSVSFWQIARVLVTKKISVQVSFETMLQGRDGSFAPPAGKPFETKVTIDLKRGITGLPSEPRGDFNADGVTDLLIFDEEPSARIHLTTREGVFPSEPAMTVPLPRAPEDRELVDVDDIDGDGRSDIAFFNLDGAGFILTLLRSGS